MDAASSLFEYIRGLPADTLIIGGIFVLLMLDALRNGSSRVTALALAFPIAAYLHILTTRTPLFETLVPTETLSAGLFIVLLVALLFFIWRMLSLFDENGRPLQETVAVLAALAIGLAVWTTTPALHAIWQFAPAIEGMFAGEYTFWILAVSYAGLAFARS